MLVALVGVSLPVFFTGQIVQSIFVYGHPFSMFPPIHYVSFLQNPLQWAENLFLPWVVLAFLYAALYARLTRAGMLETMSEDYIRTARAKGLREIAVISRHALKNALIPVVTIMAIQVAGLLSGAVITEASLMYRWGAKADRREQIEHLIDAGSRANIELRIQRFRDGPPRGLHSMVNVLDLPDEEPSLVYVENDVTIEEVSKPDEVANYVHDFARASDGSLVATDTMAYLKELAEQLE